MVCLAIVMRVMPRLDGFRFKYSSIKQLTFCGFILLLVTVLSVVAFSIQRDSKLRVLGGVRLNYFHRETNKKHSENGFCDSKTEAFRLPAYGVDDDNTAWPWDPTVTWECPGYFFNTTTGTRQKANLHCSGGSPRIVYTYTNSPRDIQTVEPGDTCLLAYIQNCCYDEGLRVPNVVHYVWYADVELDFYTMTSLISVIRFMRPCVILFHGLAVPRGTYWEFFIGVYPNVILVRTPLIQSVFGKKLRYKEHGSDVMRINALQSYGGLYLDWDEVLLSPIDYFRRYPVTVSLETETQIGNQIIMAESNATFLMHWYMGYKGYNGDWMWNSIKYPFLLWKQYPDLVHVENYTLILTNHIKINHVPRVLWDTNDDWSKNYAFHIYMRDGRHKHRSDMVDIRKKNNTVGAICRRILLGRKEVCA